MSAEQRPPTTRYHRREPGPDDVTREPTTDPDSDSSDEPGVTDGEHEYRFRSPEMSSRSPRSRSPDDTDLSTRIERARLQSRVTALERALTTSERRRRAVITQYERLLEDRTEALEESGDCDRDRDPSLLRRLLERWRR
ncbi:hypothetical protein CHINAEXTREME_04165 [Halobiforma lacisalsi AJ5]|uniref:Uncharacterized protein n=1 Tax=Natronobacterium lacisalsi AJ5 TaxID=358396 RepID=M0LRP6_NATLA|nr:hypothetical protein [Halobiforma lacisalsi]APW97014.1 hypothetical protein CHINAEXTREME_04165 [Halobiforma lacisalsi AJ5]EMA34730.1 hypothetical protein C445_07410 [Halobiforma lacisalsi AJ5]